MVIYMKVTKFAITIRSDPSPPSRYSHPESYSWRPLPPSCRLPPHPLAARRAMPHSSIPLPPSLPFSPTRLHASDEDADLLPFVSMCTHTAGLCLHGWPQQRGKPGATLKYRSTLRRGLDFNSFLEDEESATTSLVPTRASDGELAGTGGLSKLRHGHRRAQQAQACGQGARRRKLRHGPRQGWAWTRHHEPRHGERWARPHHREHYARQCQYVRSHRCRHVRARSRNSSVVPNQEEKHAEPLIENNVNFFPLFFSIVLQDVNCVHVLNSLTLFAYMFLILSRSLCQTSLDFWEQSIMWNLYPKNQWW